ncbi:MAG: DNA topoisomerase III, partial [Duncaniella sp.]|nr:DNA topoisomerase III [Duncaniella sp.]
LGRPSTRAQIIETLFKRRYITRTRKSILATQAGIELIDTIKEELLKSAKLTGIWENKLRRIARGEYSGGQVINELKQMMEEIVIAVLSDNSNAKINNGSQTEGEGENGKVSADKPKPTKPRAPRVTKFEQVMCPVCKQGHIVKGRTAFGCSRHKEGCHSIWPFEKYPETLTPAKLKKQIDKSAS